MKKVCFGLEFYNWKKIKKEMYVIKIKYGLIMLELLRIICKKIIIIL